MGNKLYVDKKVTQLEDIVKFDNFDNNLQIENDKMGFQNLKVWRFREDENEQIESEGVPLPNIHDDHFLLSSLESYIILLLYRGKEDITDISAFPSSLWGIVESSSNMTPRGLKYAFSTSENLSENLESFLLSKRDLKNSDFKYVLFIWNGNKCTPALKSNVLMKAFDLDKKLASSKIVTFLYYGYYIENNKIHKSEILKLNDIIKNEVENISDDNLLTPSSETFFNYHETVYLLHWLYPIEKKHEKKNLSENQNRVLFNKFNNNFLNNTQNNDHVNNFYDLFVSLEKKEEVENQDIEDKNQSIISDSLEDFDMVDEITVDNKIILKEHGINKSYSNKFKINLEDINNNKAYSSTETNNTSYINKEIKVPKLNMKFQHKTLNDEIISQRTKRITEDEEKLDSLESITIRKASDMILNNNNKIVENKTQIKPKFSLNFKKNLIEKEDNFNEDYDLKESERKQVVMDYFSKTMSEIIDNFLFLSGYNVAKNPEIVSQNRITHIINAAADACQNHFEDQIEYLSFNLKDHSMENIECLFYQIINFIEDAKKKNGRVLVHCIQGISRSVTLVISYLIFTQKLNYEEAFKIVQCRRSISSPNLGFSIQLQNFYQRLYESPQTFRLYPKVFAIGSFQAEQPEKIVCRLTQEQFFEQRINNTMKVFDKRGVYLIVTLDFIYIWIGSKIYSNVKSQYLSAAKNYIPFLQKYENSPSQVLEIEEGFESEDFLKIWFNTKEKLENFNRNRISEIVNEYNNWYKDVDFTCVTSRNKIKNKNIEKDMNILIKTRKCFYSFPLEDEPESMIDLDDLVEDDLIVACYEDQNENKFNLYIWKGSQSELDQFEIEEYVDSIKSKFFSQNDLDKVLICEEIPYNESDDFLNLL